MIEMKNPYLEVTFRNGRPIAAYLYLPRAFREKSYRTTRGGAGMMIDYGKSGKPIGIEITAPTKVTVVRLNQVLEKLGLPPVNNHELAPLRAA